MTGETGRERGEFGKLIRYTVLGYIGGLFVGFLFDIGGWQQSPIGQWIVRTLSGEGESVFEGIYAIRQRLFHGVHSMAEAYGWGKLMGMATPWIIDWVSRLVGVNVYAVEGFYIPYFYAMSDQIGASVSGFVFLFRQEHDWRGAVRQYVRNAVMLSSLCIILIVPIGLLVVRFLGFSPTTQIYTSLETVGANLCWIPPLIGWLTQRWQRR
jgi:hypothetical protein